MRNQVLQYSRGRGPKAMNNKLTYGGNKMKQKDQELSFLKEPHLFEVCIIVKDLERSLEQFHTLFDMTPYSVMEGKISGLSVRGKKMPAARIKFAFFRAGPMRLELLQPIEGESLYTEFLREKGIGIHHIVFRVSDLDSDVAQLEKRGVAISQRIDIPEANLKFVTLDTEDVAGVCFELVQSAGMPGE